MPVNWRTVYTLCPFYQKEDAKRVVCEGISEKSTISICFCSAEQKIEFKKNFCENKYKECPYSKILYQKWES